MVIHIFYTWQSRTNEEYNKLLIRNAIRMAANKLSTENSTVRYVIEENLGADSGYVNLPEELKDKLRHKCDIIISDHTNLDHNPFKLIFYRLLAKTGWKNHPTFEYKPNTNVIQEENFVKD